MYISFGGIAFFVVLASLYVCLEAYLFFRSLSRVIAGNTGRKLPLRLFWPLALLAAGLCFYFRYSSGGLRSLFGLASSYWGLFLFIPFFILSELLILGRFVFRRAGRKRPPASGGAAYGMTFSLWVRASAIVLAALVLVLGSFSARYAKVANYTVSIEKPLPRNGLRVILISDIHIGSMVHKKELKRIVSGINALKGDIVLIAGDIIDRDLDVYKQENLNEEFRAINAPLGVYAVPGNHDYFGGNINALKQCLADGGVKLLVDESVLLDNSFYVIGRNDFSAGRRGTVRKTLRELTAGIDASLPVIVMDHQPLNLGEVEAAGVDLQVSGHTHHGQIWPGPLITRRIYEDDYGLLYKGKSAIVVTSGCGTWGPPLRIGTRSEIVCIDIGGSRE